jgi:hypothetical protein
VSADEDVRDVALDACASGSRVLIIRKDGERFDAHVASLLHGGIRVVRKTPNGRVEHTVWYADIDSMAAYVEDEPVDPGDFDYDADEELQALSRRLREQAHIERQTSLAERMLRES